MSETSMIHDREMWRPIERAAREQAMVEFDRLENTELVFGDYIAWGERENGLTNAVSELHRVGFPIDYKPYTACAMPIPHPLMWFTLSPALVRTMEPCRFCEAEHRRNGREVAA